MLTRVRDVIRSMGYDVVRYNAVLDAFHSNHYLRHNARRLEHLASLRISVAGMSVLEVGAGIGDHSNYYIDRGCKMTIAEARAENLQYIRERYPRCDIQFLDMERPSHVKGAPFDIVHCYGLLYHLSDPKQALLFLGKNTRKIMFLETVVSFGENEGINLVWEPQTDPTQAYSGTGCRPTRVWLFKELQELFEYVYIPTTQPNHEEFPLDWTAPEKHTANIQRAIFIASRGRLENEKLTPNLIPKQVRHE
jgi:SAM-dependent methyltransferase